MQLHVIPFNRYPVAAKLGASSIVWVYVRIYLPFWALPVSDSFRSKRNKNCVVWYH